MLKIVPDEAPWAGGDGLFLIPSVMHHLLRLAVSLIFVALSTLSGCDIKREEAVRDAFDGYLAAVVDEDAEKIASHLCKSNMEWLATMGELARSGTKEQILALSLVQQAHVLSLRHVTTAAEMRTAGAIDVIRLRLAHGLLGGNADVPLALGKLKVTKTSAYAKLEVDIWETDIDLSFALEDGEWKLDASTMDRRLNKIFKEAGQTSRVSKEDLVLNIVERHTGKLVDIGLWKAKR